jgi:hypothetical protein
VATSLAGSCFSTFSEYPAGAFSLHELVCAMSALHPKADIAAGQIDVRFVPKDGVIGQRSCG